MAIALIAFVGSVSSGAGRASIERQFHAMGTRLTMIVEADNRGRALSAGEEAVRAIEATEARLSTWRVDSELTRLNRRPVGGAPL